eukprot:527498-Amphidinium_carterae.1
MRGRGVAKPHCGTWAFLGKPFVVSAPVFSPPCNSVVLGYYDPPRWPSSGQHPRKETGMHLLFPTNCQTADSCRRLCPGAERSLQACDCPQCMA